MHCRQEGHRREQRHVLVSSSSASSILVSASRHVLVGIQHPCQASLLVLGGPQNGLNTQKSARTADASRDLPYLVRVIQTGWGCATVRPLLRMPLSLISTASSAD